MEIESASSFLANLLRLESRHIKIARIDMFRRTLEELLRHHYQHHWFPEKPCKGSGYRCLRINHKMDPLIAKAGDVCGFNEADLRKLLPNELTMWIDPQEVSYRIGENGSICILYDGKANEYPTDVKYNYQQPSIHLNTSYSPINNRYPGCKESARGNLSWDSFSSDSRNRGMEQFAAYVSS
ncbi:protein BTG1 [Caerostris darwini]|uniref:Protein BTG1 n=2 Tax=Caerostris TaxID=172845 RepID=A0AAV4VIK4_9ARAC|nr:protein BTG1 [Caerostris extrusa]GIY69348.1 protein BTG1 [Caerostris darwini]